MKGKNYLKPAQDRKYSQLVNPRVLMNLNVSENSKSNESAKNKRSKFAAKKNQTYDGSSGFSIRKNKSSEDDSNQLVVNPSYRKRSTLWPTPHNIEEIQEEPDEQDGSPSGQECARLLPLDRMAEGNKQIDVEYKAYEESKTPEKSKTLKLSSSKDPAEPFAGKFDIQPIIVPDGQDTAKVGSGLVSPATSMSKISSRSIKELDKQVE